MGAVFRYPASRERAIPVGLGTDGAGTNDSLDLLQDAKFLALMQKHAAGGPMAITADETLEIAAGAHAPLLGGSGRIAAGELADFLLVRTSTPELGIGPLGAGLVYAATGTVVDGRVLMCKGVVPAEEEAISVRVRGLSGSGCEPPFAPVSGPP